MSTAYCNTQFKQISEEINTKNGDPLGIIELCKVWLVVFVKTLL